jgi:hypothetical protein
MSMATTRAPAATATILIRGEDAPARLGTRPTGPRD